MTMILHMDTDAVREFSIQMAQVVEDMKSHVERVTASVQSMDWTSAGQIQFVAEYEQARNQLLQLLQEGEMLTHRVSQEVNEWENIAPWLGNTPTSGITFSSPDSPGLFNNPFGPIAGTVGVVVSGIGGQIKQTTSYYTKGDGRAIFQPYQLNEGMKYLASTASGKDIMSQAQQNHLKFILPDGSIVGDPNGREIHIRFGKVDSFSQGGYAEFDKNNDNITDDREIVITDNWLQRHIMIGQDELAGILGHEMQHQIDFAQNQQMGPLHLPEGADPTTKERLLADYIQLHARSEVNAYGREASITGASRLPKTITDVFLFNGGSYEKMYENTINKSLQDEKVDLYVDGNGQVHARLLPKVTPVK